MKSFKFSLSLILLTALSSVLATAQPRFSMHGFDANGAFQFTISGPADVETSANLQAWAKFASVSQETTLVDPASRQMEWRFYRLRGGSPASASAIGFVKVSVPPGKQAILGNPFAQPLRLDQPGARNQAFGTINPPVKVFLYVNGNFEPHTLDQAGKWSPALRPIATQEGFSIENLGAGPLTVRLSGDVRPGPFNMTLPAGKNLVVPPVPQPGPLAFVLGIPAHDGMQIHWFNEATHGYQTFTFDALDGAWLPRLPDYRPGRALILQTPQPVTWTKSFSLSGP